MKRRPFLIGTLTAAVSAPDWLPFVDSDTDEPIANEAASNIQQYPLQHGEDVDAPADAHHQRPTAGAFLAEAAEQWDVQVQKETASWTMPAADSGTYTYNTGTNYDLAHVETFLPVAGSVLSDVRAVPSQ